MRKKWTAVEARALRRFITAFGMTQASAAEMFGVSEGYATTGVGLKTVFIEFRAARGIYFKQT